MVQDHVLSEVAEDHNKDREQECEVKKLGGCFTSGLRVLSPEVLPCDHGTAGGESSENVDDEKHDRVDQRNTGDGGLPDPRDHDGVGKTDGDL